MGMTLRAWVVSRKEAGETGVINKLREKTGIPYRTLIRYVNGKRTPPLESALAISEATSGAVPVEALVKRDEAEQGAA